jgi:hypothetical protein
MLTTSDISALALAYPLSKFVEGGAKSTIIVDLPLAPLASSTERMEIKYARLLVVRGLTVNSEVLLGVTTQLSNQEMATSAFKADSFPVKNGVNGLSRYQPIPPETFSLRPDPEDPNIFTIFAYVPGVDRSRIVRSPLGLFFLRLEGYVFDPMLFISSEIQGTATKDNLKILEEFDQIIKIRRLTNSRMFVCRPYSRDGSLVSITALAHVDCSLKPTQTQSAIYILIREEPQVISKLVKVEKDASVQQ